MFQPARTTDESDININFNDVGSINIVGCWSHPSKMALGSFIGTIQPSSDADEFHDDPA